MFRCKVMAFKVSGFYMGLLENFKKSKSLRGFKSWSLRSIDLLIQIIPSNFRSKQACNETITTYFGCLVTVS